jgi:hypothetical protein
VILQLDSIIRHVELFSGSANPAEARVYAVVTLAEKHRDELKKFQLSGHLIGPECDFAHTLPARIPFAHRGSDNTLLAEAIVPDPCFWTPELPFLYRAELELRDEVESSEKFSQTVGIRRLGVRGRELYFEGKRFVLRGSSGHVDWKAPTESGMVFLRQTWTAAIVPWPTAALCELASHRGVLLIADLRSAHSNSVPSAAAAAVDEVAQWPAAAMAIVDANTLPLIEPRGAVRNLLIGQSVSADKPVAAAPNTQIIFAEVGELEDFVVRFRNCDRPIIAVRRLPEPVKIEEARAACDALQRDLAPYGDFAGYVV